MTKEEWKQAEEALTHFFHPVELKVDGYDITLILERVSVYQNKIMVYIGGEFRGQWMAEDCEVRRRFLQEQRHNILSGLLFPRHNHRPAHGQKLLSGANPTNSIYWQPKPAALLLKHPPPRL